MRYVLSLGTNIGDRKNNLLSAVKSLELIPDTKVLDCSSIYETEPVGYAQQDDFYNIALLLESKFEPNEMLGICMGLRQALTVCVNSKTAREFWMRILSFARIKR